MLYPAELTRRDGRLFSPVEEKGEMRFARIDIHKGLALVAFPIFRNFLRKRRAMKQYMWGILTQVFRPFLAP